MALMDICLKWPGCFGGMKPKQKSCCGQSYAHKQLAVKFRRQHPLYEYVVDFYCHSHRLVIEVDGPVHNIEGANFNDSIRSEAFKEFKIEIIRFTNNEVLFDIENVDRKNKNSL